MSKTIYTDMPAGYTVCLHSDCVLAERCLHHIAFNIQKQTDEILYLINPEQCNKTTVCPHYRDNKPVRFARGFTNFQSRMFPGQYNHFMFALRAEFGRTGYFERRRGKWLLSPSEQTIVLEALRDSGVKETMEFDAYEMLVNWRS